MQAAQCSNLTGFHTVSLHDRPCTRLTTPPLFWDLNCFWSKRGVGATMVGKARILGWQARRELKMYHVQPEIWDVSAFVRDADHMFE
ncbi:hypothetical protein KL918_002148 [Ogataea parapolymorpha]|nr:hypothetical protein KL918_002148 [Ogataea parapolymorpha]KAG7871739.1 hypothetical protein KL916_003839 [Ogataea parapolymorpha]